MKLTKDGALICEKNVPRDFYIVGAALTRSTRNAYIDGLGQFDPQVRTMAKAIALQETGGTHYWDGGPIGTAFHLRYPIREAGGGGYGVMQLTAASFLNRDTIWNWKRNIDRAMEVITIGYDRGVAHLTSNPDDVTPIMQRLEGYQRYNGGFDDRYHWWNTGICPTLPPSCGVLPPAGWTKFGYVTCGEGTLAFRDYNNDGINDCDGNPFCIAPNGPTGGNQCRNSATRYADQALSKEE